MANLIGQFLGQYEIKAHIGEGGMATVYRAHQESMKRDVAIKVIESTLARNPDFVKRFQREAQTVASLSHIHILKVFDYGDQDDLVYLVMELLTGGSLADVLRQGPLLPDTASRALDQIAAALDYAHKRGIIHRDLKPQNVLLDDAGNTHLTDFGIAKIMSETSALTLNGVVMGTPAYMAPEQWQGRTLDARADIYSLGIMLFEMLTGQVPFQADTPASMMYAHMNEAPPMVKNRRAGLPPDVDAVVQKALAKDPIQRFSSAGELATAFRQALTGQVRSAESQRPKGGSPTLPEALILPLAPAGSSGPIQQPSSNQRRKTPILFAIVIIVLALIGGFIFLLGRNNPSTVAPTIPAVAALPTTTTAVPTTTEILSTTSTPNIELLVVATLTGRAVQTINAVQSITATASSTPNQQETVNAIVAGTLTAFAPTITPTATETRVLSTETNTTTATTTPSESQPAETATSPLPEQTATAQMAAFDSTAVALNPLASFAASNPNSVPDTAVPLTTTISNSIRIFRVITSPINSVAFSPDARFVLAGYDNGALCLWNTQTGELVQVFRGQISPVLAVAFSPDGSVILTGSEDDSARLWNVQAGMLVQTFLGHSGAVNSVAFSPDGKAALTGSADHTVRLWNVQTGTSLGTFSGQASWVRSVGFSPDGKEVFAGNDDGSVRLWGIQKGTTLQTLSIDSYPIYSVTVSPNGMYLVAGSDNNTTIMWNAQTGKTIHTFTGHTGPVNSVTFSPDGKYILTGSNDGTARLWAVNSSQ